MESVVKAFEGQTVINNVSFSIAKGERVSLIGPGGCGKTTLIKIVLGLVAADSGHAYILGEEIAKLSNRKGLKVLKKVGMAFQQGGLFDFMTVRENLLFAMDNMTALSKNEKNNKIKELLAAVKLSRTENMYPYELSGGMQRRIGIVRALCTDPETAIFDEPTSGLDPVTSTIILNMIKELGGQNPEATLLIATTNVEIAIRFSDRIIIMNEKGEIEADGPWRKILLEGTDWAKNFLGVRFIGLNLEYARELDLPKEFIAKHWNVEG